MKRPLTIAAILVLGVVLLGSGYLYNKSRNAPPEPLVYKSAGELAAVVLRLETLKGRSALRWQDAYTLGVAYLHSKRLDEAVETLTEGLRLRPGFYRFYESLGMAYYRLGDIEDAVAQWKLAFEMTAQADHLKKMIEKAERDMGVKKRVAQLEELFLDPEAQPVPWHKRFELATLYMTLKRLEEAESQLKMALDAKPDSAELYDILAEVHALAGDFDRAVSAEEEAVRLRPEDEKLAMRLKKMQMLGQALEEGGYHSGSGNDQNDQKAAPGEEGAP